jgi:hypothetical protein
MNLNQLGLINTDDSEILTTRMRHQRNLLLAQSDWAMHTDAPTNKTAWGAYRQALRDFPSKWKASEIANFPEQPS